MTRLSLFSEPFAPTGNMAGEGFRRLLGRPALGLLQTVLRESLQNVVDAAVSDEGPRVLVRIRTLSSKEKQALIDSVLPNRPAAHCSASLLDEALTGEVRVLEIADFRTIGLSGPTRADLAQVDGEPPNFVNFFRNVGAGRDSHHGGGTYGYGKSAFYAISRCATILADSLTLHKNIEVRRLLGCHLGAAFDDTRGGDCKRYTGRHWWGVSDAIDGVEPIGGHDAETMARSLGLPVRGIGDTGTTIMVINPELPEDFGDDGIARDVIEGILWNFWPRMTRDCPPRRKLNVDIEVEGRQWPVPKPEEFPPLDLFARALAELRNNEGTCLPIECARPQKHLGRLAVTKGLAADRDIITERPGSLIPRQNYHIALMRPVELVVKYLKGTPFPDSRFEWAGVFICSEDDEVESAFAQSEPPAHDDWVPDNLPKGREKTFINVALKRLKEEAVAYVQSPGSPPSSGHSQEGLVGAASLLGAALTGPVSAGPGRGQSPGRSPASPRQTMAGRVTFDRLVLGDTGERIARFRCPLRNAGDDPALEVVATGFVCVDGGGDAGSEYSVRVVSLSLDGEDAASSSERLLIGCSAGELVIDAVVPGDAAIGVRVELRGSAG